MGPQPGRKLALSSTSFNFRAPHCQHPLDTHRLSLTRTRANTIDSVITELSMRLSNHGIASSGLPGFSSSSASPSVPSVPSKQEPDAHATARFDSGQRYTTAPHQCYNYGLSHDNWDWSTRPSRSDRRMILETSSPSPPVPTRQQRIILALHLTSSAATPSYV